MTCTECLWILAQLAAGWFVADLVSGVYHFLVDNYGSPSTPIFGRQIMEFRRHHDDPQECVRDFSIWSYFVLPVMGGIALGLLLFPVGGPVVGVAGGLGIAAVQYSHRAAHVLAPGRTWRMLQWLRITLNTAHHSRHHMSGKEAYASLCGWSNPLLDRLLPSGRRKAAL